VPSPPPQPRREPPPRRGPSDFRECRVDRPWADQVDTRADVRVAALAGEEWGTLSTLELRACGLSGDQIAARVVNGGLHRRHRGVYAVGHAALTLEGRLLAAVKACGLGAVLSHWAAAILWCCLDPDGRDPEVTIAGSAARSHPGIRIHRATTGLDPSEVTRHRGIPVTSPARTILDLAATAPPPVLRRAVRQAQSLQRVNHRQLLEILARHPGRRGAKALRAVLAGGPAPTRSELEDLVLDLIVRGGLEPPLVNVPLILAGRRVIPDFRWPGQRLVVEADGAAWHEHPLAREDDAERQARLEAHGERVLRVSWSQAVSRPAETLARLRAAGAPGRTYTGART
jgi:hypothetical protein